MDTTEKQTRRKRLLPIPFEAQQAQSEWLLEQFEKGIDPAGEYVGPQGTNYPGSPTYTLGASTPVNYGVRSVRNFNLAVPLAEFYANFTEEEQTNPSTVVEQMHVEVRSRYDNIVGIYRFETNYLEQSLSYVITQIDAERYAYSADELMQNAAKVLQNQMKQLRRERRRANREGTR